MKDKGYSLYTFSQREMNACNEFRHKHYTCCGCREYKYTITEYFDFELIEIECAKCHEKANLNKVY